MCLFWSLTIGLILNLLSADHFIKYDILSFTFQTVLSNERKCGQACLIQLPGVNMDAITPSLLHSLLQHKIFGFKTLLIYQSWFLPF
jgi:hypothetical protein